MAKALPLPGLSVADPGFDTFWACYPKKTAKADARKAWSQLRPSRELMQTILEALTWQKQSDAWLRDGGQYVPYPATWLRGERWEDEQTKQPQIGQRTLKAVRATQEFLK